MQAEHEIGAIFGSKCWLDRNLWFEVATNIQLSDSSQRFQRSKAMKYYRWHFIFFVIFLLFICCYFYVVIFLWFKWLHFSEMFKHYRNQTFSERVFFKWIQFFFVVLNKWKIETKMKYGIERKSEMKTKINRIEWTWIACKLILFHLHRHRHRPGRWFVQPFMQYR